jgi:hypothetical protein
VFKRSLVSSLLWVTLALALVSCSETINNPSPSLKSLSPSTATQGQPGFTLTLVGNGFAPSSQVLWNGSPRLSLFLDGSHMTATINPTDIQISGTIQVVVATSQPGGGVSNEMDFVVKPTTSGIPTITSISPSGGFAGSTQLTILVTGSNFQPQSVVTWNGNNRSTNFSNSSNVTAFILQSDLTAAGTVQIAVVNPPPGGGSSNPVPFQITDPVPSISLLSPLSVTSGNADTSLLVQGSGFTAASVVTYNGVPKSTSFGANTQISVAIPAADMVAAGTVQVQILNPSPGGGPSNIVGFSVIPTSAGVGLPELIDIANNGVQADKGIGNLTNSGPSISTNGRFIAFASISTTLVPLAISNNPQQQQLYLRDTCMTASTGCTPAIVSVSIALDNFNQPTAPSFEPSISGSGRFVAFSSAATNIITGANGQQQVYLRDACGGIAGCTPKSNLISVAPDGVTPGDGTSSQAAVGSDGRFVAFVSTASNLGPSNPGHAQEIFLRDTCLNVASGCTPATFLISTPDGTALADGSSSEPAIGDGTTGQFISFTSTATNLASGTTGTQQIYRRTSCVGVSSGCTASTALVSTSDGTTPANAACGQSSISANGEFVAFASTANNLGTTTGGMQQIFLRDTAASVTLVSTPDGTTVGNGGSETPHISNNGQFVTFGSLADNLVATDTNGVEDVFVRNTCAGASGCTPKTVLASVSKASVQGNTASLRPVISGDGHFVSFISFANNLVNFDTNTFEDIFLAVTTF